jgi:hypothetical protein
MTPGLLWWILPVPQDCLIIGDSSNTGRLCGLNRVIFLERRLTSAISISFCTNNWPSLFAIVLPSYSTKWIFFNWWWIPRIPKTWNPIKVTKDASWYIDEEAQRVGVTVTIYMFSNQGYFLVSFRNTQGYHIWYPENILEAHRYKLVESLKGTHEYTFLTLNSSVVLNQQHLNKCWFSSIESEPLATNLHLRKSRVPSIHWWWEYLMKVHPRFTFPWIMNKSFLWVCKYPLQYFTHRILLSIGSYQNNYYYNGYKITTFQSIISSTFVNQYPM